MRRPKRSIHSPVAWMGGKYYSAKRILAAFPSPDRYDIYAEPFGGGAHVLAQKPPSTHLEIYNDRNEDLCNFWLQLRDHPEELVERLRSLPYARSVHIRYHRSLFDGSELDPLERAVRWYYILRSSFRASVLPGSTVWTHGYKRTRSERGSAYTYRRALTLLSVVAERFKHVQIDNRDFSYIVERCANERALLYVDPPYVGVEHYYTVPFGEEDHRRLAALLNETSAFVALSYYPHPLVDELYPASTWRRITWETAKHSQRTKKVRDRAQEILLMNYE